MGIYPYNRYERFIKDADKIYATVSSGNRWQEIEMDKPNDAGCSYPIPSGTRVQVLCKKEPRILKLTWFPNKTTVAYQSPKDGIIIGNVDNEFLQFEYPADKK